MRPRTTRSLRVLDVMLLDGSGMGLYQYTARGLFRGWFWPAEQGLPADRARWAFWGVAVSLHACTWLVPFAAAWSLLLPILRARPPRPPWRRVWRQPGMLACLAAGLGLLWGAAAYAAVSAIAWALPPRPLPPYHWLQHFLAHGLFVYVGVAVAVAWVSLLVSGRWRRPADALDRLGRVVGATWLIIGFAWSVWVYLDLLM